MTDFISEKLHNLFSVGLDFVVLRPTEGFTEANDIDIYCPDIKSEILMEQGFRFLRANGLHSFWYHYCSNKGIYINLDIQTDLQFGHFLGGEALRTLVKKHALVNEHGLPILNESLQCILNLLHVIADKRHLKFISRTKNVRLLYQRENFYKDFAFLPKCFLNEFLNLFDTSGEIRAPVASLSRVRGELGIEPVTSRRILSRVFLRIQRYVKRSGLIVVLGPDGSGKSTIVEHLCNVKGRRCGSIYLSPGYNERIHSESYFYKSISVWLTRMQNTYKKNSIIGVCVRIFGKLIVYLELLHRFTAITWDLSGDGSVICDRYPWDMQARFPSKVHRLMFFHLFPKPRVAILLIGDPNTISMRKNENTVSETLRMQNEYDALSKDVSHVIVVDTVKMPLPLVIEYLHDELEKVNWGT